MTMDDLYRLLRTGHVQAHGIFDTGADSLLVLDESLCVQSASLSFFEAFKVERDETIGRRLYELGNGQWDIPELRRLLLEVIPKTTAVINYEVEHDFSGLGRRTMLVTARTLHHPDSGGRSMLLTIVRSEEHTSELQSLMRISYAVFCLKKKINTEIIIRQLACIQHITQSTKMTIHIYYTNS